MARIAIIGCGTITRLRHAPECKNNENITLCGFYDLNQERCKEFAEEYHTKAYASFEEVLDDENVDGVIICTANRFHCEMTVKALEHGKHVMCEKPIAVTLEEAEKMIDAADKAGKFLMIAHNQRFDAVNKKLKEIADSGELGRIISFRTVFGHGGPENWSVDKSKNTWFLDKKQAGLGAMGDIGIHKADLIHWLINDDIKYVMGKVLTLDKKTADGELIAVDDNAFCVLESETGIVGTLEASWSHYGRCTNGTYLYFEKGIVESDNELEEQITIIKKDGTREKFHIEEQESGMAEAFAYCIDNNVKPEIDGKEGWKALNIVLKCIESSEKNQRVSVNAE